MKFQFKKIYYKMPFGTIFYNFNLLFENLTLDEFIPYAYKYQIRKPVGYFLYKYYRIDKVVIKQKQTDFVYLRKYKVYPVYKLAKNIKTYFNNITPFVDAVSSYAYTSIKYDLVPMYKQEFKDNNGILYVIDLDSDVPNLEDMKIYPILRRLYLKYKNNIQEIPNDIIVSTLHQGKITYIPIITGKDYNKVPFALSFLHKFANRVSNISKQKKLTDEDVNTIVNELVKDNKLYNENEVESSKKLVKDVAISLGAKNDKDFKQKLIKAISVNHDVSNSDLVFKQISKDIITPQPIDLGISKNPLIMASKDDIKDLLPLPTQTKTYLKHEYEVSTELLTSMIDSYGQVYGLKVTGYLIEKPEINENEIAPSDIMYLRLKITDIDKNKVFEVKVPLPVLHEDGTLLLSGKRWYVINQLALLPITFPKRGVAKFTSYVSTFMMHKLKKYIKIRFAGGSFPFTLLMVYLYGFDNVMKQYDIRYMIVTRDKLNKNDRFVKLSNDKYLVFPDYDNLDNVKQWFIRSLFPFSNLHKFKSDHEILTKEWFADLISKLNESELVLKFIDNTVKTILDSRTREILKERGEPTNLKDIFFYMFERVVNDFVTDRNDLRYLRNRAYEQIVHVIFDIFKQEIKRYGNFKEAGKDTEIKIDPKSIMNAIITSSSVRLLEYSNVLEEVSSNFKVTYAGYNGIPADAVPESIRGLHPTFYGNIDPVDTPEGATTGVNQTYSMGATLLTEYGAVLPKEITDAIGSGILSIATALSPFVDRTEPTRGIMISNQLKQTVSLKQSEIPAVMTGVELILPYLTSDVFTKRSPCDGKVKSVEKNKLIIHCDLEDKDVEIDLSPKLARSGQGYHGQIEFTPIVKQNQTVRKNQILTESNQIKDDIYAYGRNFVTTYMFWKGYTYEDGIVVSESVVDKLTSTHLFELFVYLDETSKLIEFNVEKGHEYNTGDILVKVANDKLYNLIDTGMLDVDKVQILGNKYIIRAPYKGKVVDVKVYINTSDVIDPTIQEKIKQFDIRKSDEPYYYKGIKFKGVFIYIYFSAEIPLQIGDKLTNRHAAKGVVCAIEPEKNMPLLPDGRRVEIIINPLSVKNRTNMGQLFELYVGEISYQLGQLMLNKSKSSVLKVLQQVLSLLDTVGYTRKLLLLLENDSYYNDFVKLVKKHKVFPIIIPPFKSPSKDNILKAMSILKIPTEYELTIPEFNTKEKAPVGLMYILKLEHMSSLKVHARSIAAYNPKTGQATAGKKKEGGQRLGELDFWALAAYDSVNIIKELFSAASDDFKLKRAVYRKILSEGEASLEMLKEGEQKTKQYIDILFKSILLDINS